jgi:heme/copper-type cytochrome/quinol oxidase subunit 2
MRLNRCGAAQVAGNRWRRSTMGILTAGIVFVVIVVASTVLRRRRRRGGNETASRVAVLGTIAIGIVLIVGLALLLHA